MDMNRLARVVHDLITKPGMFLTDRMTGISEAEQRAIKDLEPILTKPPAEVAAHLNRNCQAIDWYSPAPTVRGRIEF